MRGDEEKAALLSRLRRAKGQLEGVERMIEEDRYCIDVLFQLAAVRAALGKVAARMLEGHVKTCVAHAIASGEVSERDEKIDEVLEVFSRFGTK
ncbi:MAG: metal-sensitive transcriptional regulator [Deltaproteobacteria bacterium]|nr:metal-sensitive transcriptional regulator [Deltaproteobacteria bacterium]